MLVNDHDTAAVIPIWMIYSSNDSMLVGKQRRAVIDSLYQAQQKITTAYEQQHQQLDVVTGRLQICGENVMSLQGENVDLRDRLNKATKKNKRTWVGPVFGFLAGIAVTTLIERSLVPR